MDAKPRLQGQKDNEAVELSYLHLLYAYCLATYAISSGLAPPESGLELWSSLLAPVAFPIWIVIACIVVAGFAFLIAFALALWLVRLCGIHRWLLFVVVGA
jgi:hypothetical protein